MGNEETSEKFKQVAKAYANLSDPVKRRQYDLLSSTNYTSCEEVDADVVDKDPMEGKIVVDTEVLIKEWGIFAAVSLAILISHFLINYSFELYSFFYYILISKGF